MTELAAAVAVAQEAGRVLLRYFEQGCTLWQKSGGDVVTDADRAAEDVLLNWIAREYRGHAVISEEASPDGAGGEDCWYVDPLDGTKNFAHGHPLFCTMMARARRGEVVLAVVHDPVAGDTYTAERGGGAFRNGSPLRASGVTQLAQAILTSGYPSARRHGASGLETFSRVLKHAQALRRTGCTGLDLAYLAAGRFDGVFDSDVRVWDVAAGSLLVEEAGARMVNWSGERYRLSDQQFAAANPALISELTALLR